MPKLRLMNWRKIDIKGIVQGAYNSIFVRKWVEAVAIERTEICKECPVFSVNAKLNGYLTNRLDDHCTDCGCNIHMKTRCMDCECPQKRWLKVMEDAEWESTKQKHNI